MGIRRPRRVRPQARLLDLEGPAILLGGFPESTRLVEPHPQVRTHRGGERALLADRIPGDGQGLAEQVEAFAVAALAIDRA